MKKKSLTVLIILSVFFTFCKKSVELPEDKIIYTHINKTITLSNPDSIAVTCKYLVFEIRESNTHEETAMLKLNNEYIICDGFDNVMANSDNENVTPLDDNQRISYNSNWVGLNETILDEFAGKGEKYIGYRAGFFPSGTTYYNYGWIKIELSSDKKTLRIIERATNYTKNKFIKTGQTE